MTDRSPTEQVPVALLPSANRSGRFVDFVRDPSSRSVNVIAAASLVIAFLVKVPDWTAVPWLANLANLLSDVCVGYFPAWFVYYLVSWRPRRQDRDRALLRIGAEAIQVAGLPGSLLAHLRATAGTDATGPTSQSELAEMVKGMTIHTPVPSIVGVNLQPLTVFEMWRDEIQRSDDRVMQCMRLAIFLDSELQAALLAIQECTFFRILRMFPPTATAELRAFVPEIYEYFMLCDELRALLRSNYSFVLQGLRGLDMQAVAEDRVTNGPLVWRPGTEPPAEWDM